jgi:hypothetical protein
MLRCQSAEQGRGAAYGRSLRQAAGAAAEKVMVADAGNGGADINRIQSHQASGPKWT